MKDKIKTFILRGIQAVLAFGAICVLATSAAYLIGIAARILWAAFIHGFNLIG